MSFSICRLGGMVLLKPTIEKMIVVSLINYGIEGAKVKKEVSGAKNNFEGEVS